MAFVRLPPAPSAVVVLKFVQTLYPCINFLLEFCLVHRRFYAKLLDGIADNHVGQETGHGLFCAAIWI